MKQQQQRCLSMAMIQHYFLQTLESTSYMSAKQAVLHCRQYFEPFPSQQQSDVE
jgi:hypothetical protein